MDKESYEGYYQKTHKLLVDTILKKGGALAMDMGSGKVFPWAKENESELYKEMKELDYVEIHRLGIEGKAMTAFDNTHFEEFQDVVRQYGNVVNRIFKRYAEAHRLDQDRVAEHPHGHKKAKGEGPARTKLGNLLPADSVGEDAQVGMAL